MPANDAPYHRPLHVLAILVAAATFPLIFMGGLVTTHGAGMAVPDWPNTYGYNMFTFPPSQWVGGIWYEHVHRLWGSAVGFLSILLCLNAWGPGAPLRRRRVLMTLSAVIGAGAIVSTAVVVIVETRGLVAEETARNLHHLVVGLISTTLILVAAGLSRRSEPRRWVCWLCTGVLVAVIVQGVMGGLRVSQVNLVLAMVHGCFAHLFFCLAAFAVLATSRWWIEAPDLSLSPLAERGRRVATLGAVASGVIVLQLIAGATMRHNNAGLAIPDLPLAFGKLLPPTDAEGLAQANHERLKFTSDPSLTDPRIRRQMAAPVTLTQVWMHFSHRVGAIITTAVLAWLLGVAWTRRDQNRLLIVAIGGLLVLQFTLGVLTILWRKPADIASLHVATGALLLMCTVSLTIRALRMYSTHGRGVKVVRSTVCGDDPVEKATTPEGRATTLATPVSMT